MIRPAIVCVAVPANGSYGVGGNLDFTVTWDQNVTVTGTPRIALVIGASTVQTNYLSSPTATTTLFRYSVIAGQTDNNGITVGARTLDGGTIRNGSNVDATGFHPQAVRLDRETDRAKRQLGNPATAHQHASRRNQR